MCSCGALPGPTKLRLARRLRPPSGGHPDLGSSTPFLPILRSQPENQGSRVALRASSFARSTSTWPARGWSNEESILSRAASEAFGAFVGGLLIASASAAAPQTLTPSEAGASAQDAYSYARPLVPMERPRRSLTSVANPDGKSAPMGD